MVSTDFGFSNLMSKSPKIASTCLSIAKKIEDVLTRYFTDVTVTIYGFPVKKMCTVNYRFLGIPHKRTVANYGTVVVDEDGIDSDIGVFLEREEGSATLTYSSDSVCRIDEVHVHDHETPATHIHIKCKFEGAKDFINKVVELLELSCENAKKYEKEPEESKKTVTFRVPV